MTKIDYRLLLLLAGAGLLLLLPLIRRVLWKLFTFDKEVSKILSEKKSSEVRVGKITESLAPIMIDFPVDVKKTGTSTCFLGQPIDFIHFDPDEGITFIEVKSGGAKLSTTQRKIKKLVEEGKIFWEEYRVSGEDEP